MAKKSDTAETEPIVGTDQVRLANPFVEGDKAQPVNATEPSTKAEVIRLWSGGEHRKAMDLAISLKITADAEILAQCPGWNELLLQ